MFKGSFAPDIDTSVFFYQKNLLSWAQLHRCDDRSESYLETNSFPEVYVWQSSAQINYVCFNKFLFFVIFFIIKSDLFIKSGSFKAHKRKKTKP